ncbi:lipopolysaccharide biosynthesis protein RfbH [Candidatus Peregrinibacteria bacterium]|nr:lipopolysaccharide biosynthesis protein RfbH [Candidatus Peregrinibacteria bacterium]
MLNKLGKSAIVAAVKHLVSGTHNEFIPGETFIPTHGAMYNGGDVWNGADVASLVECALDKWYTEGKYAREYTRKLKSYLRNSSKYITLCNSGSSANLLAIMAMTAPEFGERRIKPGDEVITTAVNFPTTVNAIIQAGAIPVFVDVALGTYVPDVEDIAEAIVEGKTKAVILAHTMGNVFDAEAIEDLCREYNIFMMSDCCDSLGSTFQEKPVESYGDISTHSYYPAHHISGGEGGAVLTNSFMISKVVKSLRDWGRDCFCATGQDAACGKRFEHKFEGLPEGYDHKYVYTRLGYNLKMTDLQASLLSSQIDRLDEIVEARRYNFIYLFEKMQEFENWFILPRPALDSEPSWFGFPITIKSYACNFTRAELIAHLDKNKVGTRLLFGSNLLRQPAYRDIEYLVQDKLYNSDIVTEMTFWIGLHPSMTPEIMDYIISVFREFLEGREGC